MQASAELLDMRIAALQGQVASGEASLQPQSSDGPASQADSSPTSLMAGVASTAAVGPSGNKPQWFVDMFTWPSQPGMLTHA